MENLPIHYPATDSLLSSSSDDASTTATTVVDDEDPLVNFDVDYDALDAHIAKTKHQVPDEDPLFIMLYSDEIDILSDFNL